MHRRRTTVLAAAALAGAAVTAAAPVSAQTDQTWSFAVIGDVPYGDAMLGAFPAHPRLFAGLARALRLCVPRVLLISGVLVHRGLGTPLGDVRPRRDNTGDRP